MYESRNRWEQLNKMHQKWSQFQSKGKYQMKSKSNKEHDKPYDFNFTEYQYYYNYPQQHISMALPHVQKQFIKKILKKTTQDFTSSYLDQTYPNQNFMKHGFHSPLNVDSYSTTIKKMTQAYKHKIMTLRIAKTFYLHYTPLQQQESSTIDMLEAEIRAFYHKYLAVIMQHKFGQTTQTRKQTHKSYLKIKDLDELQFSPISKQDFSIYTRMLLSRYRLQFYTNKLNKKIKSHLKLFKSNIIKKAYSKKSKLINNLKAFEQKNYFDMKNKIEMKMIKNDIHYYQNKNNEIALQLFLGKMNYIESCRQIQANGFLKIYYDYNEAPYIIRNEQELRQKLLLICSSNMDIQLIQNNNSQHLCYQLNNLASIQLHIMVSNYKFTELNQKDINNMRVTMKRELETVFTQDIHLLLNLQQNQNISIIQQSNYEIQGFKYTENREKQLIFQQMRKIQFSLIDPCLKSLTLLLDSHNQKLIRQQIDDYTHKIIKAAPFKLQNLYCYYSNIHMDEKSHLINIINSKIKLQGQNQQNSNHKFITILKEEDKLDENLLRAMSFLNYVQCIQLKNQLLQIINAQCTLMYELQYRIKLLQFKDNLKFEMDEEFLTRFTETNTEFADPYDFVNQQKLVKQDFPYKKYIDQVIIKNQGKVEVLRRPYDNQLNEGKKIIYEISVKQLEQIQQRIVNCCSRIIERRQSYTIQNRPKQLVDRISLLKEVLKGQKQFNFAKLKLLQQYSYILEKCIDPKGLIKIAQKMTDLKGMNFCLHPSQSYFKQSYQHETRIFQFKFKTLKKVRVIQERIEQNEKKRFHDEMCSHNLSARCPQFSSIYYSDQVGLQNSKQKKQRQKQENQVLNKMGSMNNRKKESISSSYHVQSTFKQILNSHSITKISQQKNRKQELLGLKKKRLINPSVLGGFLWYTGVKGCVSIHQCISYIEECEQIMDQYFSISNKIEDLQCEVQGWDMVMFMIQQESETRIENEFIFKDQMLPIMLSSCKNEIQNLVVNISDPKNIQHYLCFPPQVVEKLIIDENDTECHQLRGLYLCLNFINIIEIHYEHMLQLSNCQLVQEYINKSLQQYSSYPKTQRSSFYCSHHLLQEQVSNGHKLIENLMQSQNGLLLLCMGNYYSYYRSMAMLDAAVNQFFYEYAIQLSQQIEEYERLYLALRLLIQSGSWFEESLQHIPNLQNKLYLQKKIQLLDRQHRQVINREQVSEFMQLLNQSIKKIKQFVEVKPFTTAILLKNINSYQNYISEVFFVSLQIYIYAQGLNNRQKQQQQVILLCKYKQILPYLSGELKIIPPQNKILLYIFRDYFQAQDSQQRFQNQIITLNKLKIRNFQKMSLDLIKNELNLHIRKVFFQPKYKQLEQKTSQLSRYMLEIENYKDQNQRILQMMNCLKQVSTSKIWRNYNHLRRWIQMKIIIFGCDLQSFELLQLRLVFCNSSEYFHIFWKDNSSYLLSANDIVRMKLTKIKQQQIILKFREDYLTFQHIRTKYKDFLDDLLEPEPEKKLPSTILLLSMTNMAAFRNQKNNKPKYLTNFGFEKEKSDPVTSFITQLLKVNPNYESNKAQNYKQFQQLKIIFWSQYFSKQKAVEMCRIDSHNKQICQELNRMKRDFQIKIIQEPMILIYKRNILRKIVDKLHLNAKTSGLKYQIFCSQMQNQINVRNILMDSNQLILMNISELSASDKLQFTAFKQQFVNKIEQCKFLQNLIQNQFYSYSFGILKDQVDLQAYLVDNYYRQQVSKEVKVYKQTINKVLAPKVVLNPFLNSPLLIENYFFAGTLKLAYIDNFLNKLKNRAIMIELAEGGFGFLLKIAELDQCVQTLCKSIISFSQKQFTDRFRTYLDQFQQLKADLLKSQSRNKYLKLQIKLLQSQFGKQIKALLYAKLNEFLRAIRQKEKLYQSVFGMLKTLELDMAHKYDKIYQNRIQQLENQNQHLKSSFFEFKEFLATVSNTYVKESKDHLYYYFRDKVEQILNKSFISEGIKKNPNSPRFVEQQYKDSEVLLQKINKYKILNQLKLNNIRQSYERKLQKLRQQSRQQSKLQQIINQLQLKNRLLFEQVNALQLNSINIEQLKEQKEEKEQEEALKKIKLIKINQNLQGKIERIEQYQRKNIIEPTKARKYTRNSSDYGAQIQSLPKQLKIKKDFRIKTEHISVEPIIYGRADEGQMWRIKWETTERKFQILSNKIIKYCQSFKISKNQQLFIERIHQISQECINSHRYVNYKQDSISVH